MSRAVPTSVRLCIATVAAGICLLALAAAAQASTIQVTTTADPEDGICPGALCSLRAAAASAGSGDTIELEGTTGAPATYAVTLGTPIQVNGSVTIEGNGPGATTIDGSANRPVSGEVHRIMKVSGGPAEITGVTFTGGNDGADEAFSGCSPCYTLNANGGGAIFNQGTLALEEVDFRSNGYNTPVGGAIGNSGTLDLTDVTFAHDGAAFGGGLFSRSGTVHGENLSFDEEGGSAYGGGAVYLDGGSMTLVNTTVADSGWASSVGGGIENHAGTLTLTNDTLAGNVRGSLQTDVGATTSVQNTIIASGFADGSDFDCTAPGKNLNEGTSAAAITTDLGNNIDQDGVCGLNAGGDQSGVDPRLAPIADNGGSTRTEALLHGSPAIGAAAAGACPAADQRGISRPQATGCDIGAFEARFFGPPSATTTGATGVSASEATLNASIDFDGEAGGIHFLWGASAGALTNETPEVGGGVISGANPAAYVLSGLGGGRTYFFRAVADNATGSATANNVQSFTTAPGAPVLSEVRVTATTDTTATVAATVDPSGADTTYVIEYGHDFTYGQTTAPVDLGSSAGPQEVTQTLTGLEPNSEYAINVVVTNAEAPSGVQSFGIPFETEPAPVHDPGGSITPIARSSQPPPPSNLFTLGKLKLNHRKGSGALRVTTPGPGALTLSGKGIKPVQAAAAGAGTTSLTIAPTAKTAKRLKKAGKATLSVSIAFTPTGGTPSTQTKTVTLLFKKKR